MCQDCHLISGYKNDTHTVVTFSRAWDTCDDQDLGLGHDTARLIWAYSEEDPGEGGSQPHPERPEEHLLVRAPGCPPSGS